MYQLLLGVSSTVANGAGGIAHNALQGILTPSFGPGPGM